MVYVINGLQYFILQMLKNTMMEKHYVKNDKDVVIEDTKKIAHAVYVYLILYALCDCGDVNYVVLVLIYKSESLTFSKIFAVHQDKTDVLIFIFCIAFQSVTFVRKKNHACLMHGRSQS
jgi:hypothetical protein